MDTRFLCFHVVRSGIHVGEYRKMVVQDSPRPPSISELHSFVGLPKFLRRFEKEYSRIAAPLTNLTQKRRGMNHWNSSCDAKFHELNWKLFTSPTMQANDSKKGFRSHVDAFKLAVGGPLTQLDSNGHEDPIEYF